MRRIPRSLASASTKGLDLFVRPRFANKRQAWWFITALSLVVGLADFFSGIELSLSLFYLVPISLSAGWLGWRAGVAFSVFCTAVRLFGDFVSTYPEGLPGFLWWNVCAAFIIFVLVVWLVSALVSAHRGLEGRIAARTSELADSIADRRRLEMELLDVTARERAAIGRELHDELGQHLVATALAAQVLAQQLGNERGGKEAHSIVHWIEDAIAKTRQLARGLLLARIESDRFVSELDNLALNVSQGGVRCRVIHQGDKLEVTPNECAQLFRIAQESVGNALRHGRARAIDIILANDEEATCLIISDNGSGFQPRGITGGMGLRIMEYRAQLIGASLAVLSTPGEGTRIICRLPTKRLPPTK